MALRRDLAQIGMPEQWAHFLGDNRGANLSAAGTTQGTAYQIENSVNTFTTVVTASAEGAILPPIASTPWTAIFVRNDDAIDSLKVYPATGESINALAANTSLSIAAGSGKVFVKSNTSAWVAIP